MGSFPVVVHAWTKVVPGGTHMKMKKLLAIVAIGASLLIAVPTISSIDAEAQTIERSKGWYTGNSPRCSWTAFISGGMASNGPFARSNAGSNDTDCLGVASRLSYNVHGSLITTSWNIDRSFSGGWLAAPHNLTGIGAVPDSVRTCGTLQSRNGFRCGTFHI